MNIPLGGTQVSTQVSSLHSSQKVDNVCSNDVDEDSWCGSQVDDVLKVPEEDRIDPKESEGWSTEVKKTVSDVGGKAPNERVDGQAESVVVSPTDDVQPVVDLQSLSGDSNVNPTHAIEKRSKRKLIVSPALL